VSVCFHAQAVFAADGPGSAAGLSAPLARIAPVVALAPAVLAPLPPAIFGLLSVPVAPALGPYATPEMREAARLALVERDARGRPFAIVDKRHARVLVFHADGRLAGATAALVGLARGDFAAPGSQARAPNDLAPHERTTPAGRFDAEPGFNHLGEAVVWVDYDAALAIHRLRPAPAREMRPQRLASASPADNRISLGCVIVSTAFYDSVVAPTLGRQRSVVYVLPEEGSLKRFLAAAHAGAMAP
jgi:hypothetical protein